MAAGADRRRGAGRAHIAPCWQLQGAPGQRVVRREGRTGLCVLQKGRHRICCWIRAALRRCAPLPCAEWHALPPAEGVRHCRVPGAFAGPGLWAPSLLAHSSAVVPQLLTVNPEHRFSCLADIQTSAYLSAVPWGDVCQKRLEPGFVPNVSTTVPRPARSLLLLWARGIRWGGMTPCVRVSAEGPPALRPHLRAGGDDPGVQAPAQEEEEAGEEQITGQQQGQLAVCECCWDAAGVLLPMQIYWGGSVWQMESS